MELVFKIYKTKGEKIMRDKIKKLVTKAKIAYWKLGMMAYGVLSPLNVALADDDAKADVAKDKWDAVIDFMLPWISRLGGVVILIGAVEFGLAFKNDDAEGKTKGMRTVIAGCIVVAVGMSAPTFLY